MRECNIVGRIQTLESNSLWVLSLSGSVILNKVFNLSNSYRNHLQEFGHTLFFVRLQRCIGIRHSRWHWFLDIHGWLVGFTMKNVCQWNKVNSADFFYQQVHANVEGWQGTDKGWFIYHQISQVHCRFTATLEAIWCRGLGKRLWVRLLCFQF